MFLFICIKYVYIHIFFGQVSKNEEKWETAILAILKRRHIYRDLCNKRPTFEMFTGINGVSSLLKYNLFPLVCVLKTLKRSQSEWRNHYTYFKEKNLASYKKESRILLMKWVTFKKDSMILLCAGNRQRVSNKQSETKNVSRCLLFLCSQYSDGSVTGCRCTSTILCCV